MRTTVPKKQQTVFAGLEHLHRPLFELSNDAIFIADVKTGTILDCNKQATRLLKLPKTKIIGLHQSKVHPPGESEKYKKAFKEHIRTKGKRPVEGEILRSDGVRIPVEIHATLVSGPGGRAVMQGVFRDISERKKAEADLRDSETKYRRLFETSRDGIMLMDAKTHKIVDVNPALLKSLGYSKKAFIGKTCWEAKPFSHEDAKANMRELRKKNVATCPNTPLIAKNGEAIRAEVACSRYPIDHHQLIQCNVRDISGRILVEEALRESMERFRAAFDSSAIGMALVSPTGSWIQVNPSMCAIVGYTESELMRLTFQDITHPDDLADSITELKRLRAGKTTHVRFEKRYIRKDKTVRWVQINVSAVHGQKNTLKYFVTQVDDITDRKLGSEALEESEEKFRSLAEHSLVGIYLIQDELFQYVNPTFAHMFGYEPASLIGKLGPQALVHASDWPTVDQSMKERLKKTGPEAVRYRFNGKKSDGRLIRLEVFGSRTVYRRRSAIIGTALDVTEEERKDFELRDRAEELKKFQLAVSGASDHIIITDPEGAIVFANKAAERITGFSIDEMLGKNAGALWGGRMEKSFYKEMWHAIKDEKRTYTAELTNHRKSGETYIAESTISPILNDKGEVIFFVGIERDITKAKEIDRMKSEFISVASHQLRTPLSTAGWYTEMLLTGDAGTMTPDQIRFVREIERSNKRSIALINALLDVSRLETGRMLAEPKSTNVQTVTNAVVASLNSLAERQHVTIQTSFDQRAPNLFIDPEILGLVLQNLLSNAIKYSKDKGIVRIEVVLQEPSILIRITDNGVGIPQVAKDRVFTKFFRADNARTKDPDGTGLGLYIARSAIELVGGKIWFESEVNKGTTFFVSIPINGKTVPIHR